MNAFERRQYEMLLRVRDFGNTHRQLFSAPGAQQTFAAVSATIDNLTATALLKVTASVSARADRKEAKRKALVDLLARVSQLARVLRAGGWTLPAFTLPASKSDQALLTTGRQFARDAATVDAEFSANGMGSAVIGASTTAFETALRDRGMSRADRTAARARIRELISSALLDVRRLDLMVQNELATDAVVQAVWKQARRVEEARGGSRGATDQPAPTPAPASEPEPEPARAAEPDPVRDPDNAVLEPV
jgi:hypothetical protein